MSAQIRRTNDRSRLVQESGRRLYATDLPYEEAMDQLSQKYMDSVKLIKQSEFKKPYLEDDYNTMEYAFEPPNPPEFPPGPGGSVIPDCTPKNLGAWGKLGTAWELCADSDPQATMYLFDCCHKIVRFSTSSKGLTLTVTYLEGDKCLVTIAGVRDTPEFMLEIETDRKKLEELIRRECCPTNKACGGKCDGCPPPTIGYDSQQMTCGGVQALTHSGGGAGGKYTWSANYGTFDAPSGPGVNFTAPASNAECAANPTITLTDCCGHTATLNLAVNCHPGSNPCGAATCAGVGVPHAYRKASGSPSCVIISADNCQCQVATIFYGCDGSVHCAGGTVSGNSCLVSYPPRVCDGTLCAGLGSYFLETRTACMKTAGCCPASLL